MYAERERKGEQATHSRRGERGVRGKWRMNQTNRRSRKDRRVRQKVSRWWQTQRNEEEEGTDCVGGGADWGSYPRKIIRETR